MTRPRLTLKQALRQKRDAEILVAYLMQPDVAQAEIAARFGLSSTRVGYIINRAGARDEERQSRIKRRQHREGLYDAVDFGPRKRSYWPDCPPELRDEYRRLRRKGLTGSEARAVLDPGGQA